MKLSAMTTDHVADVLSTAAIELEPILADEKVMTAVAGTKQSTDENTLEYGMRIAQNLLGTVLLFSKTYRQGLYRILAEFAQCTPEEIGLKTINENWEQIKDCLNDEVFLSFFPSLKKLVQSESSDTSPKPAPKKQKQQLHTL
jgi:hypothetical protein